MKTGKAKLNKRFLTLIELLLVITIIASIAGVVGLSVQRALREQRFKNEVEEFVSTLRLAQNLMLITDADIHVKISEANGDTGILYTLESDRKLPAGWDKELIHASKKFKTVHHFSYTNATDSAVDLQFFSTGTVMSRGTIALATGEHTAHALVRYIDLPGYPSPIQATLYPKELRNTDDEQIGSLTVQEIRTTKEKPEEDEKA